MASTVIAPSVSDFLSQSGRSSAHAHLFFSPYLQQHGACQKARRSSRGLFLGKLWFSLGQLWTDTLWTNRIGCLRCLKSGTNWRISARAPASFRLGHWTRRRLRDGVTALNFIGHGGHLWQNKRFEERQKESVPSVIEKQERGEAYSHMEALVRILPDSLHQPRAESLPAVRVRTSPSYK